jgi:diguanylate cyclase
VAYADHPDEVAEEVYAGLSYMAQHGVPTNPNNIAVWYAYASGKFPDVRRTIDKVIAQNKPFTEELCAEIHDKFFGMARESRLLEEASARIVSELHRAKEYVSTASEKTSRIEERLERYAVQLEGDEAALGIKSVVDRLIEETKSIGEETSSLSSSLEGVVDEVKSAVENVMEEGQSLTDEAGQLASALDSTVVEIREIERSFKETREESLTDALTGVRNRKFFDHALENALAEAKESGATVSLCVIDLDHFSQFNQAYGSDVGDQLLRLVAKTVIECIKGQDMVGRTGGEEFAVLLPDTAGQGAATAADNIRAAFGRKTLTNRRTGERYGSITLSMGIAEYRPNEVASQLMRRAIDALVEAKEGGRDRVVVLD